MRVASFVNFLEFEFEGNIVKNAICLGDVDNDGLNELVVGNDNGVLAIFKGENPRPIRYSSDLGMISAVAVGDVFNTGTNALVVVTGCGYCYIYDFEEDRLGDSIEKKPLQPIHAQRIPSNVKVMLIGDVNGDGFSEMVVALTDRVVRTYRWVNCGDVIGGKPYGKLIGLNKWELGDQIGGITFNKCKDGSPSLLVSQPGGTYFTLKVQPAGQDSELDPFDETSSELLTKMSLDYEPLASARLRNPNIHTEICGNIRLGKLRPSSCSSEGDASEVMKDSLHSDNASEVMKDSVHSDNATEVMKDSVQSDNNCLAPSYALSCPGMSGIENEETDPTVCSTKPACSRTGSDANENNTNGSIGYALTTLDGTLMLVCNGKIQWNLQVDHQLFAVCGLDVTGDGRDEVVACAWDGNTYIVCESTDCVRFTFHEPVSAFTAGLYGLRGQQVPSLVYASFNNCIYLYHDLTMSHTATKSITEILKKEPEYSRLLDKLGIDRSDSENRLEELHKFLLYGKVKQQE